MWDLARVEFLLGQVGGWLAFAILAIIFYGIGRGVLRPPGRTSGRAASWLRSGFFYLLASLAFLFISVYFWKPLPVDLSPSLHLTLLIIGCLLYFPGMGFLLWARLTLGKMYFVSTSLGAQLFADHRLITSGPFSIVRHPMYLGLLAASIGGLLLYHTWTTLGYALFTPFVLRRIRREEQALAAEFKDEWLSYCHRVPAFFPRLGRKGKYDGTNKN
jgi:protein-S-isoprenylcysteine O-methyltransferase Ste14